MLHCSLCGHSVALIHLSAFEPWSLNGLLNRLQCLRPPSTTVPMFERLVTVLLAVVLLLAGSQLQQVAGQAEKCDPLLCSSPDCRCATTDTPGGLDPSSIPQFVLFTFDDIVSPTAFEYYENVTNKFINPNGCPVSLTFYVQHVWTDYSLVNKLHRMGHEIASHSVSHHSNDGGYWNSLPQEDFAAEAMDVKTMLNLYGKIPLEDVTGFRVPNLAMDGNAQFGALHELGFKYDCSWPTQEYTPWYTGSGTPKGAMWPYTLDYASPQEETSGPIPTESFPGLWVNPMTENQDNNGWGCFMLDWCSSPDDELTTSGEAVFEFYKRNFLYHYEDKRTPFPLYTHYTYLENDVNDAHHIGLDMFMSYVSTLTDVYLATVDTVVEWTRNPVPLDQIDSFAPLSCATPPTDDCLVATSCHYSGELPIDYTDVWMTICGSSCPCNFPWIGNPYGACILDQKVEEHQLQK